MAAGGCLVMDRGGDQETGDPEETIHAARMEDVTSPPHPSNRMRDAPLLDTVISLSPPSRAMRKLASKLPPIKSLQHYKLMPDRVSSGHS